MKLVTFMTVVLATVLLTGCGDDNGTSIPTMGNNPPVYLPDDFVPRPVFDFADLPQAQRGAIYQERAGVTLDTSHIHDGYLMIQNQSTAPRIAVRIHRLGDDQTITHLLRASDDFVTLTFTRGSGMYLVDVLEDAGDNMFAPLMSEELEVTLVNELWPFLMSNRYVTFHEQANAIQLAAQLAEGRRNELEVIEAIYNWIITNIAYDHDFAEEVTSGMVNEYVPNIDVTLASGMGICFDYAALMAAMLRSQNIPTRLEIGFAGEVFHAWVSVYARDSGWLHAVAFNPGEWSLMDPTFTASDPGMQAFVGDGSNYHVLFTH